MARFHYFRRSLGVEAFERKDEVATGAWRRVTTGVLTARRQ